MISLLIFWTVYSALNAKRHFALIEQNLKYGTERVQMLELVQDLNRMEQMDTHIRKMLGAELQLSIDTLITEANENVRERHLADNSISYVKNIPSHYPVNGFITQKANTKDIFIDKNHTGIDLAVKEGEPIFATASGFVVYSGWTFDYGNYIILYHGDDYFSVYGHQQENFVSTRDFVKRGEVIGAAGDTGISSGPHLHFEIWKDGIIIDPLDLFPKYNQKDLSASSN